MLKSEIELSKEILARSIVSRRKKLGISQEKLALDADVDRTYISQLERRIANPSLATLCKIADILNCDLLSLLSGPDDN